MKVLYIIFSHSHEYQVIRLSKILKCQSPNCHVLIHHDPKGKPLPNVPDNVHLVPEPVDGQWGDFSLVEQYLVAFRYALKNFEFDWIVTLTGLSYLVRPLIEFEKKLDDSPYDGYLHYFLAENHTEWPKHTALYRYFFRYINLPRLPYYYKFPRLLKNSLKKIKTLINSKQSLIRIHNGPRSMPPKLGVRRIYHRFDSDFFCYAGRQALNINRKSLEYIFSFLEENESIVAYYKKTLIPDESIFLTILLNNNDLTFSKDVPWFFIWPDRQNPASGSFVSEDNIEQVIDSGCFFASKFDGESNPELLELFDQRIQGQGGGPNKHTK